VSEELGRQLLAGRALFALLLGMFAITVGCGIVLPILRFLIERLTATADAAILSWHTGLLTGTYILAIFLFTPPWDMSETEHGEESATTRLSFRYHWPIRGASTPTPPRRFSLAAPMRRPP